MNLDRLLEGLSVTVEPLGGRRGNPRERPGAGVLELACGASVRFSPDRVAIVPVPRGLRVVASPAGVRIRVTYQGVLSLFAHLDEPLVVSITSDDPARRCLQDFLEEVATVRPGSCAMAEALFRRFLILLLRRCLEGGGRLAWLATLEDARLGRAVAAMRDRPEHRFTLAELADIAGMSRTVFAARFASALAQPPIDFLKTIRLSRAAELLARSDLPIKAIASEVGYVSRSSFTRAFVARHGAAPKAFRTARSGPALSVDGGTRSPRADAWRPRAAHPGSAAVPRLPRLPQQGGPTLSPAGTALAG
jgi:AraC-like DNA-binding protein